MIQSLLHPSIEDYVGDKLVEFGVERASMNIMAAKCLYKRSQVFGKNKTLDGNLVLNRILLDNSRQGPLITDAMDGIAVNGPIIMNSWKYCLHPS